MSDVKTLRCPQGGSLGFHVRHFGGSAFFVCITTTVFFTFDRSTH